MRGIIAIIVLVMAGCSYDPAFGDLSCESEGATRPGQRCVGGVWVVADVGIVPDGAVSDGGTDPDPDMSCEASESDGAFCTRLGFDCGEVTDTDNCGVQRTADCGACDGDGASCANNVCELTPESDEELCEAAGATCGSITVEDRTGAMRTIDNCGDCADGLECGVGDNIGPNTCGCADADDEDFCEDNQDAECGLVTAVDPNCGGVERTVNCGTCTAPESCGGAGEPNQCGCVETSAEICARLNLNCGSATVDDICGSRQTVDCGMCTAPESCGGGPNGAANVCGCDVVDACAANGAECGTINVAGMCTNIDTADCGGCGTEGVCNAGANTCMCNAGYAYRGSECTDINECAAGTDMCDPNATCSNTPGSYDCTCNAGFSGDGFTCVAASAPTVAEIQSDTSNSGNPFTPTMTGVDGDLYIAFVSIRTSARTVLSVSGLGLTWVRSAAGCDSNNGQRLEVWTAQGNTTGDSNVLVALSGPPFASAAVVYRVTDVPANATVVTQVRNRNGINGACDTGGQDANFLHPYTPQSATSLILTGVAMRSANFTPGVIWSEDEERHREDAGLATMQYTNGGTTAISVAGSFDQSVEWADVVVEIY